MYQPLITDKHGVLRYKGNEIVKFLLEISPMSLNELHLHSFSDEDWDQFNQLLGVSKQLFDDIVGSRESFREDA